MGNKINSQSGSAGQNGGSGAHGANGSDGQDVFYSSGPLDGKIVNKLMENLRNSPGSQSINMSMINGRLQITLNGLKIIEQKVDQQIDILRGE